MKDQVRGAELGLEDQKAEVEVKFLNNFPRDGNSSAKECL